MDLNQTSGIAREMELAKLTVVIGKFLLHRIAALTATEPTRLHDNVGPIPFCQFLVSWVVSMGRCNTI